MLVSSTYRAENEACAEQFYTNRRFGNVDLLCKAKHSVNPLLILWRTYLNDHVNKQAYRSTLKDFAAFLGIADDEAMVIDALFSIDVETALRYREWSRRQRGQKKGCVDYRSAATTNQRLGILKCFMRLAMADGLITRNPFERVKLLPKNYKRPTKALPAGSIRPMLDACEGLFERALIAALIGGALRRSEAQKLRLCDIVTVDGVTVLKLRATKNGTDPAQPLADWAAVPVLELIADRILAGAMAHSPLFVSRYGACKDEAPVDGKTIYRIVKRVCERAGIDATGIGAHSCRATAVTALLSQEIDRKAVKDFGRFATYTMLDVYDKRARPLSEHAGLKLKI